MANAETEIDLEVLHKAITDQIAAQFPDLQTVECYRDDRHTFAAPACLIDMSEMQAAPDLDPGTEQTAVTVRWDAQLIIGFRTANAKLEIRKLAAALAAFIKDKQWTPGAGASQLVGAYPDEFDPQLDQYEVWRVEWEQVLHLGRSVWAGEGYPIERVYLGVTPDIGPNHIDDYVQVAGPIATMPLDGPDVLNGSAVDVGDTAP